MSTFQIKRVSLPVILGLALASVALAQAKPNPAIKNTPIYNTPDIWVDNDGDGVQGPGEPAVGKVNRLFARIRNDGSTKAKNVEVTFAYAPWGLWSHDFHYPYFLNVKSPPASVSVGDLAAKSSKVIEVPWKLDLSQSNGGKWGGYFVRDFNQFCVWVTIKAASDANPADSWAMKNFTQVSLSAGTATSLSFLVANPRLDNASADLAISGIPASWEYELTSSDSELSVNETGASIPLEGGAVRRVTLTVEPPAEAPAINESLAVRLFIDGDEIGGVTASLTESRVTPPFPPSGGELSPYLTGTYDLRGRRNTVLHIVNPTGHHRRVVVALFDDDEKPLACLRDKLSPNDLLEVDVGRHLSGGFGVVKVVSFHLDEEVPEPGLVGTQRDYFRGFWGTWRPAAAAALHSVPAEILEDDLAYVMRACN